VNGVRDHLEMETRVRDDARDLHDRDSNNDVNDQQVTTSEAII